MILKKEGCSISKEDILIPALLVSMTSNIILASKLDTEQERLSNIADELDRASLIGTLYVLKNPNKFYKENARMKKSKKGKKEKKLNKMSNRSKVLLTIAGVTIFGTGVSYLMDLRTESAGIAPEPETITDVIAPPEIIDPIV